jgi:hypothetical protein
MLLTKFVDFVRSGKLMPLPAPPTDRMILRPCTERAYWRSAFQFVAAPRPLPGRLKYTAPVVPGGPPTGCAWKR